MSLYQDLKKTLSEEQIKIQLPASARPGEHYLFDVEAGELVGGPFKSASSAKMDWSEYDRESKANTWIVRYLGGADAVEVRPSTLDDGRKITVERAVTEDRSEIVGHEKAMGALLGGLTARFDDPDYAQSFAKLNADRLPNALKAAGVSCRMLLERGASPDQLARMALVQHLCRSLMADAKVSSEARENPADGPSDFALGVMRNQNLDKYNRNVAEFEKIYRQVMGHVVDSDEGSRFFDAFDHANGDLAEFEHELVTNPGRFYLKKITSKEARALHAGIKKLVGESAGA